MGPKINLLEKDPLLSFSWPNKVFHEATNSLIRLVDSADEVHSWLNMNNADESIIRDFELIVNTAEELNNQITTIMPAVLDIQSFYME